MHTTCNHTHTNSHTHKHTHTHTLPSLTTPTHTHTQQDLKKIKDSWITVESNLHNKISKGHAVKIYCDREDHLNATLLAVSDKIVLVPTPAEADVLYLVDHTISCEGMYVRVHGMV